MSSRFVLAAASLTLISAQAQVEPVGGESKLLGASRLGDQTRPHIALDENGGFVVWEDNSVTRLGSRIRLQPVSATGVPVGPDVVASSAWKSKATGFQDNPQVALLPDGAGAAVVWQGGKPGFQQIYLRRIGANGKPIKSDVRVSKQSRRNQVDPQIVTLADGTLLVVWASWGQDGSMYGIFAQRFTGAGAKLGTEFQINEYSANNQRDPAVAALGDGGFVVAWISELKRSESSIDVVARKFDSAGAPLGDEFLVNELMNVCANPSVAASEPGFLVAWSEKDNGALAIGNVEGVNVSSSNGVIAGGSSTTRSGASWDVLGRCFNSDGTPVGDPFAVNSTLYGDQFGPSVSGGMTGYFVAWTSLGQDGSREGVFAQAFTPLGVANGAELQVNQTTFNRQLQPVSAISAANEVTVLWSGFVPRFGFELFSQGYLLSTP